MNHKKNVLLIGVVLSAFILLSTPALSTICKTTTRKEARKIHKSTEMVTFEVYECKDGEYQKTIKKLPLSDALELKEALQKTRKSNASPQEKIKRQMSILKDYELIPQRAAMSELRKEAANDLPQILSQLPLLASKFTAAKSSSKVKDHVNILGGMYFGGEGLTFALGMHTLLPTVGVDLMLVTAGVYYTEVFGLLGTYIPYVFVGEAVTVGFAGFLVAGLFGVYTPFVIGLGVYGATFWKTFGSM